MNFFQTNKRHVLQIKLFCYSLILLKLFFFVTIASMDAIYRNNCLFLIIMYLSVSEIVLFGVCCLQILPKILGIS